MARKSSIHIKLTNEERFEPERRARSLTAPHRIVVRAKVILMLAEGQSISGTAVQVGRGRRIVHKWAKRFVRKPTGPANHLKRYLPRSMPRLRLLHSHSDSPERQQGLALRFPLEKGATGFCLFPLLRAFQSLDDYRYNPVYSSPNPLKSLSLAASRAMPCSW